MSERQTGRTTRMLAEALADADSGKSVLVVAANAHDADRLRGLIGKYRKNPSVCHVGENLIGRRFDRILEDHYVNEYLRECGLDYYSWMHDARARLNP